MNFRLASFDKLSAPLQSLVFVAFSAPLFAVFVIAGDLPRGTLAWSFSGALMIAANALRGTSSFKKIWTPAALLLVLHFPLVVWDPLKHASFFGGIIQPIALVDGCIDYAFLWSWLKIFKKC